MSTQRSRQKNIDPLFDLNLFCEKALELRNSELIRQGSSLSLSIKGNDKGILEISSKEPNENILRSGLTILRQFIQNGEPINLFYIYNLCQKYIKNDIYRDYLQKSRSLWLKSRRVGDIPVILNGVKMTPEYIFDLFINGDIFHSEPEKRKKLKSIGPPLDKILKHKFLYFCWDTIYHVLYVENIIRASLREGSIAE
jgi:hypothetical protein